MKKRKLMIAGVILALSTGLYACKVNVQKEYSNSEGNSEVSEELEDKVDTVKEEGNDSDDEHTSNIASFVGVDEDKAVEVYVSDEFKRYYDGEDSEGYDEIYYLEICNDGSAVLYDKMIYNDYSDTTQRYVGTITSSGDKMIFEYGEKDSKVVQNITIEDDMITNIEYVDTNVYEKDINEIVGTYTAKNSEYGNMTLTIEASGNAVLECDKSKYVGSIFVYDNGWELYANNVDYANSYDEEEYLDWMLELNGGDFTYTTYSEYIYGAYAGDYEMVGDLGDLTFHVDKTGTVTADIMMDGAVDKFSGYISIDSETNEICWLYLSTEDGKELSLEIGKIGDQYNYFGKYTIPLGAG